MNVLKLMVLGALFLLPASVASAQTVDSWQFRVYLTGASAPLSTTALLRIDTACGLSTAPTGVSINPNKIAFTDPAAPLAWCLWTDGGTGVLNSLPFGAATYDGTLAALSGTLVSGESAKVGFTHPGLAPAAPTNLRIVR